MKPIIQQFNAECSLSRSVRRRSGLKNSDISEKNLYGTNTDKWNRILSKFDTIFVLKTGNGDEMDWIKKVVLDHKAEFRIIDIEHLMQIFLNDVKDRSIDALFEHFHNKKPAVGASAMEATLLLGEKILREIVYLYSRKDTILHTHLLDLTNYITSIPEMKAVFELVQHCKDSGWLTDDMLAQPNPLHKDFDVHGINGRQILKDILPVKLNIDEDDTETTVAELVKVPADAAKNFLESDFIKQNLPGYEKRDSQIQYAQEVTKTVNAPMHHYAEAPTGIGKSLGYLLPAALFAEKNPAKKIVIATATKNLQNQIIEKDWPLIKNRFPDAKITILKGKSNYICTSALARHFTHSFGYETGAYERLAWLSTALFLHQTDGDLEHIPYQLFEWVHPLKDLVMDVRADLHCTPTLCKPSGCIYGRLLSLAEEANIVITNHYKAVTLKDGIIGNAHALIIDEAERFGDNVRQALSVQINSRDIHRLFYRIKGNAKRKGFVQILEEKLDKIIKKDGKNTEAAENAKPYVLSLATGIEFLELAIPQILGDVIPQKGTIPPLMQHFPELRHSKQSLEKKLEPIIDALCQLTDALENLLDEEVPLNKTTKERCETYRIILSDLTRLFDEFSTGFMTKYYAHHFKGDPNQNWSMVKLPVPIQFHLKETIYQYISSILFTSATLYIDNSPEHFIKEFGSDSLDLKIEDIQLPTVFDYEKNALCIIDTSITPYNYRDPDQMEQYRSDVDKAICTYSLAANGRTLVLFMSQHEMERSYANTSLFFREHDILPLRQNGTSLDQIREFERNEYSILFGIDRFWAGVDFPGSTLSQVIIVKAPNPSLNNPLIAHQNCWDANFFQEKYPIYGKLKLKQGFGRLIRSIHDKGGVIILDSRYAINEWFLDQLYNLPLQVTLSHDQEFIMRTILKRAGLHTEFKNRHIDPFLEVAKFEQNSIDQSEANKVQYKKVV